MREEYSSDSEMIKDYVRKSNEYWTMAAEELKNSKMPPKEKLELLRWFIAESNKTDMLMTDILNNKENLK